MNFTINNQENFQINSDVFGVTTRITVQFLSLSSVRVTNTCDKAGLSHMNQRRSIKFWTPRISMVKSTNMITV